MNVRQQSVDVPANTSRNLTETGRGDISSLIVRWSSRTGRIATMALVTSRAPGRGLDGRYKRLPARRLVQAFGTQQGLLPFVCRRLCNSGRRLGIQKRSLSDARAEGGRLRRHWGGSMYRTRLSSLSQTGQGGPWSGLSMVLEACRSRCFMPGSVT